MRAFSYDVSTRATANAHASNFRAAADRLIALDAVASGRAVMWSENGQVLRVAQLVGDAWVSTATPFPVHVQADQTDQAEITWTPALGRVVAAAPAVGQRGRIDVRHLQGAVAGSITGDQTLMLYRFE